MRTSLAESQTLPSPIDKNLDKPNAGSQKPRYKFICGGSSGKGCASPTQLGLKLLRRIPTSWSQCFNVRVLADSGFDSSAFIDGVNALGLHGVIGSKANRDIGEGHHLYDLRYQGTQVQFKSCITRVYAAWFQLRQARGEMVWRYVISTRAAEGRTITRWGKRRWRVEATLPVKCTVRVKKRFLRR